MNTNVPTQAQLAAIGFSALAIGKSLELLSQQKVDITQEQQGEIAQVVGKTLRKRFGNEVVDNAKEALGQEPEDHEAEGEEIEMAVGAVREAAEKIATLPFIPSTVVSSLEAELRKALVDAYDEEDVSVHWPVKG